VEMHIRGSSPPRQILGLRNIGVALMRNAEDTASRNSDSAMPVESLLPDGAWQLRAKHPTLLVCSKVVPMWPSSGLPFPELQSIGYAHCHPLKKEGRWC